MSASEEATAEQDSSSIDQRPGEKSGTAEFRFPNGDSYDGGYKMWPDDKGKSYSITRHGDGTYTTWDGNRYTGTWTEDSLDGQVTIEYVDGSTFTGCLKNGEYTGDGRYRFPDGSCFQGAFIHSQICGEGVWIDAEDQEWRGLFATDKALSLRFKHNL